MIINLADNTILITRGGSGMARLNRMLLRVFVQQHDTSSTFDHAMFRPVKSG
jgi:hypothetical protein